MVWRRPRAPSEGPSAPPVVVLAAGSDRYRHPPLLRPALRRCGSDVLSTLSLVSACPDRCPMTVPVPLRMTERDRDREERPPQARNAACRWSTPPQPLPPPARRRPAGRSRRRRLRRAASRCPLVTSRAPSASSPLNDPARTRRPARAVSPAAARGVVLSDQRAGFASRARAPPALFPEALHDRRSSRSHQPAPITIRPPQLTEGRRALALPRYTHSLCAVPLPARQVPVAGRRSRLSQTTVSDSVLRTVKLYIQLADRLPLYTL